MHLPRAGRWSCTVLGERLSVRRLSCVSTLRCSSKSPDSIFNQPSTAAAATALYRAGLGTCRGARVPVGGPAVAHDRDSDERPTATTSTTYIAWSLSDDVVVVTSGVALRCGDWRRCRSHLVILSAKQTSGLWETWLKYLVWSPPNDIEEILLTE